MYILIEKSNVFFWSFDLSKSKKLKSMTPKAISEITGLLYTPKNFSITFKTRIQEYLKTYI